MHLAVETSYAFTRTVHVVLPGDILHFIIMRKNEFHVLCRSVNLVLIFTDEFMQILAKYRKRISRLFWRLFLCRLDLLFATMEDDEIGQLNLFATRRFLGPGAAFFPGITFVG